MTQDEIIEMLHKVVAENQNFTTWTVSTPHLVGLVHHAIAKEREACAKVCEELVIQIVGNSASAVDQCAKTIRARGQA